MHDVCACTCTVKTNIPIADSACGETQQITLSDKVQVQYTKYKQGKCNVTFASAACKGHYPRWNMCMTFLECHSSTPVTSVQLQAHLQLCYIQCAICAYCYTSTTTLTCSGEMLHNLHHTFQYTMTTSHTVQCQWRWMWAYLASSLSWFTVDSRNCSASCCEPLQYPCKKSAQACRVCTCCTDYIHYTCTRCQHLCEQCRRHSS